MGQTGVVGGLSVPTRTTDMLQLHGHEGKCGAPRQPRDTSLSSTVNYMASPSNTNTERGAERGADLDLD